MSPTVYPEALALIEAEYQKIVSNSSSKDKCSSYNTIIQLKQALSLTAKPEVYTDIKGFIKYYVLSTEEAGFGYDTILFSTIVRNVIISDMEAKLNLYKYSFKVLKSNGYDDQAKDCEAVINELTLMLLKGKHGITSYIHRFYLLTTQSKAAVTLSLFLSVIIATILLWSCVKFIELA